MLALHNYNYEVILLGHCHRTTDNLSAVFLYSDIISYDNERSFMSVRGSSCNNCISIPVQKKIYIELSSALTSNGLTAIGYRRIGTNV